MVDERKPAATEPRRTALRPGAVVAEKYRLEAPIGRGAMGAVWSAVHLGLGERVAIKFIDPAFAASPETRRRFETEARATAKIRSRFVVSVFDNGALPDGTLFLVMECLQGETLRAFVRRAGALPLAEAVAVACEVGRALGHAHARGVIHRDIKPSNIFLADTPDDGRVAKVLDFGVAKLLQPIAGMPAGQTSAGALLGTPQYMSPEQARGRGEIGPRTDIFSLGLVFFHAYVGRPPRRPGPVGEMLARILTEPLPSLCDVRPDAPPALGAWFARACALDPHARFDDVEACLEALVGAADLPAEHPARAYVTPAFGPHRRSIAPPSRGRSDAPPAPAPASAPPPPDAIGDAAGAGRSRSERPAPPDGGPDDATHVDRTSVPPSPFRASPTLMSRRRAVPAWGLVLLLVALVFGNLGAMLAGLLGDRSAGEVGTVLGAGARPRAEGLPAAASNPPDAPAAPTDPPPDVAPAGGAPLAPEPTVAASPDRPAAPAAAPAPRPGAGPRPAARPKASGAPHAPDLGY